MGYYINKYICSELSMFIILSLLGSALVLGQYASFATVASNEGQPSTEVSFEDTEQTVDEVIDLALNGHRLISEFYVDNVTPWVDPVLSESNTSGSILSNTFSNQNVKRVMSQLITGRDYSHTGLGLTEMMTVNLLSLQRPIKESILFSSFGGWRGNHYHQGIDFSAPVGTPIYASEAGQVTYSDWYYDYGKFIKIDHGASITTHYAHCQDILVADGEFVSRGQLIGYIGLTGRTTGAHLHFELAINSVPVNPMHYLASESLIVQASRLKIDRLGEAYSDTEDPFAPTLFENPQEIALEF